MSLEWLSIFVEDCFSSTGNCIPLTTTEPVPTQQPKTKPPSLAVETQTETEKPKLQQQTPPSLEKFVVPSKARSKRKRVSFKTPKTQTTSWVTTTQQDHFFDSPLLHDHHSHWLQPDSELILPKDENPNTKEKGTVVGQPRRCTHCLAQRTPQWRAGPLGPKTLCNACGVRYKSGRLLPEYRPAKSPTFVSYLHSNSHKKVMEMRMSSI